MSETVHVMREAVNTVLLYGEGSVHDPSVFPDAVQHVNTLEELPVEYQVLAATALFNVMTQPSLPVDLTNERDVRYLVSEYDHATEYVNARTDTLTKLPNRRGLEDWLRLNYNEHKNTLGVIAIDVTGFKKVNDTFDHATGDNALVTAVEFINRHIRATTKSISEFDERRKADTQKDIVARVGGDEFMIVINLTNTDKAMEVLERIVSSIEQTTFAVKGEDNTTVPYGFRVGGLLSTPESPIEGDEALRRADKIMNAKRTKEDR